VAETAIVPIPLSIVPAKVGFAVQVVVLVVQAGQSGGRVAQLNGAHLAGVVQVSQPPIQVAQAGGFLPQLKGAHRAGVLQVSQPAIGVGSVSSFLQSHCELSAAITKKPKARSKDCGFMIFYVVKKDKKS
jgi:hypothetical protein